MEKEALEVEISLIDFIGRADLTNLVKRFSTYRGQMTIEQVATQYDAPKIQIRELAILIKINRLFQWGTSEKNYVLFL